MTSTDPKSGDAQLVVELREKLILLADSIESCADVNYWRIPLALAAKITAAREAAAKAK